MPAASASLVIRDGGGSGVRPPAHWRRREEEEEADASSSTITSCDEKRETLFLSIRKDLLHPPFMKVVFPSGHVMWHS